MKTLRQPPSISVLLVAFGIAWMAGGWRVLELRRNAAGTARQLAAKSRELQMLRKAGPGCDEEAAKTLAEEMAGAENALQELRATVAGPSVAGGTGPSIPAPETRTDAYIVLAAFNDEAHERAVAQGVEVGPEERFGFAAYAHGGPEPERIAAVHQQLVVTRELLDLLFQSRPRRLVAVQRERPRRAAGGEPVRATETGAQDYFEMDARLTVGVPALVEADAFRLVFTGHTRVLREFLNRLIASGLPLAVRAVEVEPAPDAGEVTAGLPPSVEPRQMRFSVTVEHLKVISARAVGS